MTTLPTHARCGGTLHPEEHSNWVTAQGAASPSHKPVRHGTEILYRCDKCYLVGVLSEQVVLPAWARILDRSAPVWSNRRAHPGRPREGKETDELR